MVTLKQLNNRPPQSIPAEKAILSELLFDIDKIPQALVYPDEIFCNKDNKELFKIIRKAYKVHKKNISKEIIMSYLDNNNNPNLSVLADDLWDDSAINSLVITKEGGFNELLKRLKALYNQRQAIRKMQKSIDAIKSGEDDFNKIAEDTSSFLRRSIMQEDDGVSLKDGMEDLFANWGEQIEYPTGIEALDKSPEYNEKGQVIGGGPGATMKPGQLIIEAARPAMGKTMVAMNILINQLEFGHKCWLFSFEMSQKENIKRLTSAATEFNWADLKREKLEFTTQEEYEDKQAKAGELLEKWDLDIYTSGRRFSEFVGKVVNVCEDPSQENPKFIFIDYLQLMDLDIAQNEKRHNRISEATRQLKELASEYGITIFCLSQLSRAVEKRPDKQPQLSDLRGSGGIEEDADMVIMLYRENYYDKHSDNNNTTMLIRKHRNGPTGEAEIGVKPQFMKIYNIEQEENQYANVSNDNEEFYEDNNENTENLDDILDENF